MLGRVCRVSVETVRVVREMEEEIRNYDLGFRKGTWIDTDC